jgi:transposase, IS5 family
MCKEKPPFTPESLHIPMYKNPPNRSQLKMEFLDFPNPFGVKLRGDNRWARLSRLIPWEEFEHQYAALFNNDGSVAYPFRMALGAEILKERLGVTDRELVVQISENPYLQYFLGLARPSVSGQNVR